MASFRATRPPDRYRKASMAQLEQHAIAVAGVIFDDEGRVLLMRRSDRGNWEPPGGVLKVGERLEEGVRREVHEETRVAVEVERLTGVYENVTLGVVSLVFRCRPARGEPTRTREAAEVVWATPDEVDSLLTRDYADWIHDARVGGDVAIRPQTATVKGASSSPVTLAGEHPRAPEGRERDIH